MGKSEEYRVPSSCYVCSKPFKARYNVAGRAKVCTPPSHRCVSEKKIVNGKEKKITCTQRCCRDRYRKASASMSSSALDSRKYLNEGEYRKTIKAICALPDQGLRLALWFILETGCRLGEALLVRRGHLDWRPGKMSVVMIPTEKKVGHPALPVHIDNGTRFCADLRRWAQSLKSEAPLFSVGRRRIQRTFERILDKIKPDRASLVHILRHTRASRLSESGMAPNAIRSEMRWASIELLKVYEHTSEVAVAKALGRMR